MSDPVDFDARPPRLSAALSALVGVVAVLASLTGHLAGVALVAAGVGLLVVGAAAGSSRATTGGGVLAALAFLFQATVGAGTVAPLVGLAATVVAWDIGDHAIGLGEQIGRAARTRHAVVAHATLAATVATLVVVGSLAFFRAAPGGRPFAALLFLLLAAILIPVALGE